MLGVELTRQFSAEDYARGLESWAWLDLDGKRPLFASPFGDVFLCDEAGFWWLDTLEGRLELAWRTADELAADLKTEKGQDRYLLTGLAWGAELRGLVPTKEQVYGFAHPPVLGGPVNLDNVETIDFVMGLDIGGQIHRQVRDLPPGTTITGITLG
jgi:hypothetical protein